MDNNKNLLNVSFSETIVDYNYEKIAIDLKDKKNILELSKKDSKVYKIYKELISHDFMFYFHNGTKSYFIKRKLIKNIWKRNDLVQYGDLFYTIEKPLENRINSWNPLRLVVVFSSMTEKDYYEPNIGLRCFMKNFPTIQNSILKNTIVMRIMDINLSHGSHYINTSNYLEFEDDIQGSVAEVISRYHIHKDDVVFYGASKGGTGALYHSLFGDYNSVCIDPIISLTEYNTVMSDKHYLKGLRKESILEDLLELSQKDFSYEKIIIGSPAVPFNYRLFSQLKNDKVRVHDIFDESIKTHPDISSSCISEQVTFINSYFLNSNNYKNNMKEIKMTYKEIGDA